MTLDSAGFGNSAHGQPYLAWQGTSPDGYLSHTTSVYATSTIPPEHRETFICRIVCMYMIGFLSEKSVIEACESLSDIYKWQIESSHVAAHEPQWTNFGASTPKQLGKIW
jgi:hypothetical protein